MAGTLYDDRKSSKKLLPPPLEVAPIPPMAIAFAADAKLWRGWDGREHAYTEL
jgi:hypothetical protein